MGNYEGLPSLFICVGIHEIRLDDCINVANKVEEHGVHVKLIKWPKMMHAFPMLSPMFSEAQKAMPEICEFALNKPEH